MSTEIRILLSGLEPDLRATVEQLRAVIQDTLPNAAEEVDESARLIGYTYKPGTYKHLVGAIAVYSQQANLVLSTGAELVESDTGGLLEGTGKKARHIVMRTIADTDRAGVRELLNEADKRTPRPS